MATRKGQICAVGSFLTACICVVPSPPPVSLVSEARPDSPVTRKGQQSTPAREQGKGMVKKGEGARSLIRILEEGPLEEVTFEQDLNKEMKGLRWTSEAGHPWQ